MVTEQNRAMLEACDHPYRIVYDYTAPNYDAIRRPWWDASEPYKRSQDIVCAHCGARIFSGIRYGVS